MRSSTRQLAGLMRGVLVERRGSSAFQQILGDVRSEHPRRARWTATLFDIAEVGQPTTTRYPRSECQSLGRPGTAVPPSRQWISNVREVSPSRT